MQLEQCLVQFIFILHICDVVQKLPFVLLFSYVLAEIPHCAPVLSCEQFTCKPVIRRLIVWYPSLGTLPCFPTYAIVPYIADRQSNQ